MICDYGLVIIVINHGFGFPGRKVFHEARVRIPHYGNDHRVAGPDGRETIRRRCWILLEDCFYDIECMDTDHHLRSGEESEED